MSEAMCEGNRQPDACCDGMRVMTTSCGISQLAVGQLPVEYHKFATLAHLLRDTSKQTKGDQTNERGDAAGVRLD